MPVISAPGVYSLSKADYLADPCPQPSLNSSGARTIMQACPAKFWHERLNPTPSTRALDIGDAAHEWLLEGDAWPARHHVLPEGHDGRTKEGKIAWEAALKSGKAPLKAEDFAAIKGMVSALRRHEFAGAAFANGKPEQTLIWRDKEFGIWCRARLDWLPNAGTIFADYKTTRSAEPEYLRKAMYEYGYAQQAAWYLDGIRALGLRESPSFLFVFQEKDPPYLVTCVVPSTSALAWGEALNRKAKSIFVRGLRTGKWAGYADDDIIEIGLPDWAEKRLQGKHDAGLFEIAAEWQAPHENTAA